MSNVKLTVASWNRFRTRYLAVQPDLVGAEHEFVYEACRVKIQLPSKKHLPKEPHEGELLTFDVEREVKGEMIPKYFWVHAVDVIVFIPEQVTVTGAILSQAPNAYDVVPNFQQEELNKVAEKYTFLSERAFDFWIRTLRWKCHDSRIGRPEISGNESGWGTYLTKQSTGQRIWNWSEVILFEIQEEAVTLDIWSDVHSALRSGINPPVFVELMFDAIEHMRLGDLQRATVDMAVACECYLRMLVSNNLPPTVNEAIREYVDDANIRTVLTKFVPEFLNEVEREALEKIKSRLHKLFNARNDILHTGQLVELKLDDCGKFIEATEKLFIIRD